MLRLVHGRFDPDLRSTNTLELIDGLFRRGAIFKSRQKRRSLLHNDLLEKSGGSCPRRTFRAYDGQLADGKPSKSHRRPPFAGHDDRPKR